VKRPNGKRFRTESATKSRSPADTTAPGTQIDEKSRVPSFEEEVGLDPELDEPVTLGELLASRHEDPVMSSARNIDRDAFLASHDYRSGPIVKGLIECRKFIEMANAGTGYSKIYELRQKLADDLLAFMGEHAIEDSPKIPAWRGNLMADRERAACQADRRRH